MIDFHVHVFPDWLRKATDRVPVTYTPDLTPIDELRRQARKFLRPIVRSFHATQTLVRHLPDFSHGTLDRLGGLLSAPMLVLESTPLDLTEEMQRSGLKHAVVIASPPFAPNDWILQISQRDPRFIPCIYAPETPKHLRDYVARGARLLKLHPAMDGKSANDPSYLALLETAEELSLPVILHTGCIHLNGFYKRPELGSVHHFQPWFKRFKKTPFVLAHMNFHEPRVAIDFCAEFPNLWVDTSWQPAEAIAEAVRLIGSERILLGSDWPLLGGNIPTAIARVKEITKFGTFGGSDVANILGRNASRLLKLQQEKT